MVSVAYFDTIAFLKQYVVEIGSDWVQSYVKEMSSSFRVFTSSLTVVEAICAFGRRLREGVLIASSYSFVEEAFNYDVTHKYNLLEPNPLVLSTACQMAKKHPLRAYDSVQLASAWLLNEDLITRGFLPIEFICADDRLLAIAQSEGLLTRNPNHYP